MHIPETSSIQKQIQQGRFTVALTLCKQALESKPTDTEVLYLAAVCCRYLELYGDATGFLKQLVRLLPGYGRAYQEFGHIYRARGENQKALENYLLAVKRNPSLHASWQAVSELSGNSDEHTTATHNLDYLKHLPKALASVLSFIYEDRLEKAEKLCRHFMLQHPKHVEGMRLLAKIAEKHHVLDDAEFLLETALQLAPENHWLQFDYVNILHHRQKFESAYVQALMLSERLPEDSASQLTLANQEAAIGKYDDAIKRYQSLLAKDKNNALLPLLLGHVYKTIGQQQEAIDCYLAAINLNTSFGDPYWSLANLKTFSFSEELIEQMLAVVEQQANHTEDMVHLHFALGKAFENQQAFERSFEHYQTGNKIKRDLVNYDSEVMANNFSLQKQFFTPEQVNSLHGMGEQAEDPIFVLGLPRTGSTLVEQILSSHSQIDGTLELPNILAYVQELNGRKFKRTDARYPKVLAELSADELAHFGQRYLKETQIHRKGAAYFIDKMPNNFRHIGLIKSILPNAKIIDTRREPLSCCFSVYKQLFAEGQEFSYSFDDIAKYYQGYVDLMAHWHQVYPGQILTLDYEALVASPTETITRLFDYIGLALEPACLEFYKTKRAVRTASSEQVRQPINQKGVEQWKHYEPYLAELKATLAE
ncbi:tetratricopeptide repeat-containing sulfotransferase family protein [Thalassomonas actiniarum]|uniref:Sulfotransferase n=1 Tax=Thalassomonas actiniarum TaxID=485447 RepID=A0AAE9YPW0_9GAMM|nr:tetratricopeptide repeat-containing sulfotransferase family protein [Thalassomonas actiniarum]WDD98626.1 sulfotransferase [Thalassomonas actiniarum]